MISSSSFGEIISHSSAPILEASDHPFLQHLNSRPKSLPREPILQAAVTTTRGAFEVFKHSPKGGQRFLGPVGPPIKSAVRLLDVEIPRKRGELKTLMDPDLNDGAIKGTWMVHQPGKRNKKEGVLRLNHVLPGERVILYAHGGGFVAGSKRTHRGVTARLAEYSNSKVLCMSLLAFAIFAC
jgi:acetyl esterase/lipase